MTRNRIIVLVVVGTLAAAAVAVAVTALILRPDPAPTGAPNAVPAPPQASGYNDARTLERQLSGDKRISTAGDEWSCSPSTDYTFVCWDVTRDYGARYGVNVSADGAHFSFERIR